MIAKALDKLRVRQSFAAAAASYDTAADLQRRVGLDLLRRFPLSSAAGPVMDLGCGTGFLAGEIMNGGCDERLLAVDLVLPMLEICRRKLHFSAVGYVCADAESLPFRDASLGQLYSNLVFQWLENLHGLFGELRRVISSEGQLVFATFGPRTLAELKAAWASVDDAVHVNQFASAPILLGALEQAGFAAVNIETELYRCHYPSVMALMRELKALGAHNVNRDRKLRLTTKSEMQRMIEAYQQQMPGVMIEASYEVLFVCAQKC